MKKSQLRQLIREEIKKNKKLNEAMKFSEDLSRIIAYGLMEAGVLAIDGNNESELRKINEIILNILLKAGEKDNYTI